MCLLSACASKKSTFFLQRYENISIYMLFGVEKRHGGFITFLLTVFKSPEKSSGLWFIVTCNW